MHIQKEMFILRDASDRIKPLLHYIKHYKGPYSKEIKDSIDSPMFLEEAWEYIPSRDNLPGGYIELTEIGIKLYESMVNKIQSSKNMQLIQILAAMKLIHDLYDELSSKELLYIVYTNPKYSDFVIKSLVYNQIVNEENKAKFERKLSLSIPSFADNEAV